MTPDDIAVALVRHNGGRLVGETRLQRTAYLLHRAGANLTLAFVYHQYGPHSFELAQGWKDAKRNAKLAVEEAVGRHAVTYSIFTLSEGLDEDEPDTLGDLSGPQAQARMKTMAARSPTTVELASALVYLRDENDWKHTATVRSEIVDLPCIPLDVKDVYRRTNTWETVGRLKGFKATDDTIERAEELLRDLALANPTRRAHDRRTAASS